jgi:hypothetical protein
MTSIGTYMPGVCIFIRVERVFRSMVDDDTDRYVLEVLSPRLRRKLEDGKMHTQWTDLL